MKTRKTPSWIYATEFRKLAKKYPNKTNHEIRKLIKIKDKKIRDIIYLNIIRDG